MSDLGGTQTFTRLPIRPADDDLFRGRKSYLGRLLRHLPKRGVSAVIYGERGIGKTSLSLQVMAALEGSTTKYNDVFNSSAAKQKFKCIAVKDLTAPSDRSDLLISAVMPSDQPNSLRAAAPKLYLDDEVTKYFTKTYSVSLSDSQALSIFGKLRDNEDVVSRFFEDVMTNARRLYPNTDFLFFIDEVDKMKSQNGLGELIKNANGARFVFVGIADTLEEIIKDHASAHRRITGGIIDVEPMSPEEVRSVFLDSLQLSFPAASIPSSITSGVVRYSGGIPWLIHVAGESVAERIASPGGLGRTSFKELWDQVRREWEQSFGMHADLNVLDGQANKLICETFINAGTYLDAEAISDTLKSDSDAPTMPTIRLCLSDLEAAGILLQRGPNGSYRFVNPIVRAFCFERIDSERSGRSRARR